jgi:LisH-like dimerisation domain
VCLTLDFHDCSVPGAQSSASSPRCTATVRHSTDAMDKRAGVMCVTPCSSPLNIPGDCSVIKIILQFCKEHSMHKAFDAIQVRARLSTAYAMRA